MQVKGKVIKSWVGVPSTQTMEVKEGLVGPQKSSKAGKSGASIYEERDRPTFDEGNYPGLPWS
jgi:hypothetical protein